MQTLVIETSTERGIVACLNKKAIIFSKELPFSLQNAQYLLPMLQQALSEAQICVDNFSLIVVGVGPGSYTGIRVGAMIAKTLSFACSIPLVGVCTLDAFVPDKEGTYAAVIDAKIGGVYMQTGLLSEGKITQQSGPIVCPLSEAISTLKSCKTLVTSNATLLRPKLEALFPEGIPQWSWQECYPSVERMAFLGEEKFHKGEWSQDGRLELLYMRKTQAELEKGMF